jgi:hypothetical protein
MPAEFALRAGGVEDAVPDVTGPLGGEAWILVDARHPTQRRWRSRTLVGSPVHTL